jgi:hypothetical protein
MPPWSTRSRSLARSVATTVPCGDHSEHTSACESILRLELVPCSDDLKADELEQVGAVMSTDVSFYFGAHELPGIQAPPVTIEQ